MSVNSGVGGPGSGGGHTAFLIYSIYLINKAGGLIYQKDFSAGSSAAPKRSTNDYLRLASTFHSLHAITAKGIHIAHVNEKQKLQAAGPDALPTNQEGMQTLEAKVSGSQRQQHRQENDFRLQCYQTLTGLKFLIIASPNYSSITLEKILQQVYLTYTDYVLKNPFYELEMPIRLEQFDFNLQKLIQSAMGHNIHGGGERREK